MIKIGIAIVLLLVNSTMGYFATSFTLKMYGNKAHKIRLLYYSIVSIINISCGYLLGILY